MADASSTLQRYEKWLEGQIKLQEMVIAGHKAGLQTLIAALGVLRKIGTEEVQAGGQPPTVKEE